MEKFTLIFFSPANSLLIVGPSHGPQGTMRFRIWSMGLSHHVAES